jgi:hypothetical protein
MPAACRKPRRTTDVLWRRASTAAASAPRASPASARCR